MQQRRTGRVAVAAIAGAALALTAAPAASANTGCYYPSGDRQLRIIPQAESCKKGERRISWSSRGSSTGDRGARGPRGLRGLRGVQGTAGAPGPQGPQGVAGLPGAPGETGATGAAGADGAAGPQGPQGVTGPAGAVGPMGPAGPVGADGATGPAGTTGADGPAGPIGPAGPDGPAGPAGPAGPTGPAGQDGIGTIFTSNSGQPALATTIAGGLVGTVTTMPLSGSGREAGVQPQGGSIGRVIGSTGVDAGQVITRGGVITSITAQASLAEAQTLVGSMITQRVSVWRAVDAGSDYTPIAGADVVLPGLSGVLAMGTSVEQTVTGLSIPINTGDRLLLVYSATATGLALVNSVPARVTASVAIS